MGGGFGWFVAGAVVTLLVVNDQTGRAFSIVAAAVGGLVTFVLELGGMAAVGNGVLVPLGALVLIGLSLLVGREWTERARAAERARNEYETAARHRGGKLLPLGPVLAGIALVAILVWGL